MKSIVLVGWGYSLFCFKCKLCQSALLYDAASTCYKCTLEERPTLPATSAINTAYFRYLRYLRYLRSVRSIFNILYTGIYDQHGVSVTSTMVSTLSTITREYLGNLRRLQYDQHRLSTTSTTHTGPRPYIHNQHGASINALSTINMECLDVQQYK